MRHLLASALLVPTLAAGQQPPTPQAKLERMLAHAESASVYRARVNWPTLRAEVRRLADTATTTAGLAPALRHLLRALGDEHGRVFHGGRPIAWFYGAPQPHLAGMDTATYRRIQWASDFPFRAELLPGGTGYVRIVGLPMGDNTAMSASIEKAVCAVQRRGATRWIVDLRYNGGGNLNPMAEGIAAIIGDGAAGGWQGATRPEDGAWRITSGDFDNHGYSVHLPNGCRMPASMRVAVLTSMYTTSSGEALAVMFRGRRNTRLFGEKTGGMVTNTDWAQLDDSTAMTISVGHYRDRTGRVYDAFVDPDEEVPFTPTDALATDAGVQRALAWLRRAR